MCLVYDLKDSFRPIHIPENATFEGEFYLGTSSIAGDGILVQSWVGNTTNPRGTVCVFHIFRNVCVYCRVFLTTLQVFMESLLLRMTVFR